MRVYQTNPEFREELEKARHRLLPVGEVKRIHYQILSKYGVPASCNLAILLYLSNPNQNESEFLKLIIPPVRFLNSSSKVLGPQILDITNNRSAYRPDDATDFVFEQLGKPLRDKLNLGYKEIEAITKRITSGLTFLLISPYTQKSELIDILNEYWDELSRLINTPGAEVNDLSPITQKYLADLQTKKLASKVYQTKTSKNWERDELIMELTAQGLNDTQIAAKLVEKEYGSYTPSYIRQIRYRQRKDRNVT